MAAEDRFGHLLQPIRDLAENWSVDISSELEEYLEVLEGITFSFEGGPSLNFAEAALLIQGSACVYSKKVEYLHSLVYQALEFIAERKRKDQRGKEGGTRANPVDDDNEFDDEEQFLSLDDVLEEGAGIDLEEDNEPIIVAPTRLPATLLALESTDGAGQGDNAASKYRIASCTVHHSGALLLEARDGDALDARLEPIAIPKLLTSTAPMDTAAPTTDVGPADYCDDDDFGGEYFADDGGFMDVGDDDDDMGGVVDGDVAGGAPGTARLARDGPQGPSVHHIEEAEAMFDPYAPLDPNDRGSMKSKPFRRARRVATKVRTKTTTAQGAAPAAVLDALLTTQAPVSGVMLPQFQYAWDVIQRAKSKENRKVADAKRGVATQLASAFTLEEAVGVGREAEDIDDEPADFGGFGGFDDDDDDDYDGPGADFNNLPDNIDFPDAGPHWMGAEGGAGDWGAAVRGGQDPAAAGDELSYEELCRAHIEAFISAAAAAEVQTELASRVTNWRTRMEPMLEEEDARPEFDIKAYGEKIIDRMAALSCDDPEAVKMAKAEVPADVPTLEFANVVEGLENKYEVSRMFSSTLQLINSGNVHINKLDDGFTLKLLKPITMDITQETMGVGEIEEEGPVGADVALMPSTNKGAMQSPDEPKKGKTAKGGTAKATKRRKA